MLKELKVYENLYENCCIYLNRNSAVVKFSDDELSGRIHAYVEILNDEYIVNTYKNMKLNKKEFSKFYIEYYREEFGLE